MHSRIKQLADECETTYIDRDGYRSVEFDKAKFTELIVRECVTHLSIARDMSKGQSDKHSKGVTDGFQYSINAIERIFK